MIAAVGEGRRYLNLATLTVTRKRQFRGFNRDAFHRAGAGGPGSATRDPLAENVVLPAIDVHPLAASMRRFQRCLQQRETLFRLLNQDARLFVFLFITLRQPVVV